MVMVTRFGPILLTHVPRRRRRRPTEPPTDPRKIDRVPVLVGVGLLAFEIAFVIIVGAKR
jgi:hypothetical protein